MYQHTKLIQISRKVFFFPFEDGACQVVLRAMVCRGSLVIHKTLSTIQQHYSARSHQAIAMQHNKVCVDIHFVQVQVNPATVEANGTSYSSDQTVSTPPQGNQ